MRVLAALHCFGHRSYQLGVGHGYCFALSQPNANRCVTEVANCIVSHLLNQWIQFPTNPDDRQIKKQRFSQIDQRFFDLLV